jgi:hypothetical protein
MLWIGYEKREGQKMPLPLDIFLGGGEKIVQINVESKLK